MATEQPSMDISPASPFDSPVQVKLRAALEVSRGLDAAQVSRADFLAKSLGVPAGAVLSDMDAAETEHQAQRIGQAPALANFAAESETNAALVRGDDALVQLAERIARSKGDMGWLPPEQKPEERRREEAFGAYRQGEHGMLEKFKRSYIAGFEDVWDNLRGTVIAGLENPEAVSRNLLAVTALMDKEAFAKPFAAAKVKAGEMRATINKERETRNPPVFTSSPVEQYLMDFTKMAPQVLGAVGTAAATGGAGSTLFIGSQIAGGKYLNLTERGVEQERALAASLMDAGLQAPLESIGIGKIVQIFKTSGFFNILKAMGVSGGTEFITEWLQVYPEKATEIWAEAEVKGRTLEESFKHFFDNFWEYTKDGLYEGLVAAPFGFVLGSGHLASQYRHEEVSRKFVEAHVALSEGLAQSRIKQMAPEQAETLLERMGVNQNLVLQAKDVQELYQSGIDLTPALGVTIEDVRKKAVFGHEFEVRAATLHRYLEPGQAEQVFSHTRAVHAPMSHAEMQDETLLEENVKQVSAIRKAGIDEEISYQAERARLHEGFTRAVEAVPGLKAQAEGMAGSVSAYLDHALALADAALPRLAALSGESRASVLARIVPQMLGAKRAKPSKVPLIDAVHDANAVADMEAAGFVFDDEARGLPAVGAPDAAGMAAHDATLQQRFERQHKRRPLAERDPVLAHVWGRLDGKSLKAYDTHGYKDIRAVRGMGLFRSAEKGGQSLDLLADELARSGLLPQGSGANELLAYLRGDGLELHQALNPEVDLDALVPVVRIAARFAGENPLVLRKRFPKNIREGVLREFTSGVVNEDTGMTVGMSANDFKEHLKIPAEEFGIEHMEAIAALPELMRTARLVESHTDKKPTHGSAIKQVHRFIASLNVGENDYAVLLTVKEFANGTMRLHMENPVKLYHHRIEKALSSSDADIKPAMPATTYDGRGAEQPLRRPSADTSTYKISQLLEGVNDSEGKAFLQSGHSAIRGATALHDNSYHIRLMQRADLSTLPHEFSHVFLLEWQRIMDSGVTDAAALADWQAARKWLGAEDGTPFTREQHERFARGFEAYLMEGKAPAPELAGTFARFKRWLLAIYKDAKNLGVELDDDIRGVFDRMLATEQQIEEAAAVNELYSLTEAQLDALGVTGKDRVYAAGLMGIAKERGLAKMQEDLDKERGARLKAWATEATEELAADRVYMARSELYGKQQDGEDTGPWLDIEAVREGFGDLVAADLRKALGGFALRAGGQDPEIMAARHGFISGADLIGSLVVSESRAKRIKAMVAEKEAAFEAARAQGMNPAGYILEAEEAVAQVEFVGRYLAKAIGKDSLSRQAFAQVAADELDGMAMGKAVSQPQFLAALRRALRDERRAVASGDFYAALEANHKARLNLEFVRQSRDMERLQQKTTRQTGRFVGMGKADPDARYLVMDIAMRHGLGKYNARLAEGREATTPRDWLAAREAEGYSLFVDDAVLYGPGKPWKEMTAGEFTSMAETVAQVVAVERNARQLLTGAKRQALDDAAEGIAASILAYRAAQPQKTVEKDGAIKKGTAYGHAVHTKMEALCVSLDGGKTLGPTWEHIFRPIAEADDAQAMRFKEVRDALRGSGLFGMYTRGELAGMGKAKTFIKEIGETLTREQQIAVALNMGNEGNYTRLQKGHGWDDAQIAAVVAGLTKKDWDFVQAVWDYIGSFREEAFALHESITGLRPKAVEARPLMTPHGQYAGGYYPVKYDSDKSFRAFSQEQKAFDQELFGGRNHGAAMTKKGHLQDRAGKGAGTPLLLELSVITDHIFNVVHDLSFRKPVMDVAKVIGHAKVRTAIETTVGHAQYRELRPWLQDVAGERQEPMHFLHRGARWARASTSIMQMGYKFTTMFTQPLGFTQSVEVLGYRYAGRGLKTVYGNPLRLPELVEATFAKSAFMAQRLGSFDREVRDITKKLHQAGRFAWVDAVRDNAFVPMGVFQLGVDLPTWWGAYEKGMKEHGGDEGKAVRYADSAVRLSQGSGSTKDLARIQRGGEFGRLATMFYSYFNTFYNLAALRFAELKRDRSPAAIFRAANTALLLWFVPAVLAELAAGRGPDDDEEPWEWAAEQVLVYPFMAVVGVRDVVGAMASGFGYQITPGQSAPASLVRWFTTVNKALEKDEWDEKKLAMATTEAVGYLARLPLKQAIISVGNVWDYLSGDDPDFEVRDLFFVKPKSRRR